VFGSRLVLGKASLVKPFEEPFKLQADLYKASARNFLLYIGLLPVSCCRERVFISSVQREADDGTPYTTCQNEILLIKVKEFAASYPETTDHIFSAWDTFTRVLDQPRLYGFTDEDVGKAGGGIWSDHLHPTAKMHDIRLASDISAFLYRVPVFH
jgi:hypothetical protein